MKFNIKRFYLDEILKEPCPECGVIGEFENYLIYPETGPNEINFYCYHGDDCFTEWVSMYDIQLIVTKIEEKK